ncbi:uncharacterized protein CC84DRAFT_1222075 [Paraphaeosphaeria sporulosa]|uniref:Uncharacterized protein n=1 Tax=Paraphaeosphaeria sporulosa TaxID=1460663 RepID=A0A177BZC6_9PLEO|nr:uncharacterized protein CC84DRAFT_1222075 [Paraphaeosphaeria sporulosa]OAG00575.1 hypothetical protein CC84DRAFT_1222075 [Paraphaeosphaeria sporulosa]
MAPNLVPIEANGPLSAAKFDVVPSAMHDRLQTDFEHACSKYTKAAVEAPAASYGTQYEIKKALIYIIPKHEPEITTIQTGFAFAESANIGLIGLVIDNRAINFAELCASQCDSSSAEQQRAHPGFLECHAVDSGALSWGIDAFGCLSLCILVQGEAHELRREAYFVQRVYARGEDGPRAGGLSKSSEQESAPRSGFSFSMKLPDAVVKGKIKAKEAEDEDRLDRMMEAGPPQSKKPELPELSWEEYQAEFWRSHGGKPNYERTTKRY